MWKLGLFDCMADCGVCLWSLCVPCGVCCMQAQSVHKATQQGTCVPYMLICCCGIIGAAINRSKIRQSYGIPGSCCGDYCTWCFCANCAACQEYNDSKKR